MVEESLHNITFNDKDFCSIVDLKKTQMSYVVYVFKPVLYV